MTTTTARAGGHPFRGRIARRLTEPESRPNPHNSADSRPPREATDCHLPPRHTIPLTPSCNPYPTVHLMSCFDQSEEREGRRNGYETGK